MNDIKNDIDYFDEFFMMQPQGENGILFSAEYARLQKIANNIDIPKHKIRVAIDRALFETKGHPLSHDNMTAIVCLSKQFSLEYHKSYAHRDFARRLHPRDISFYLICMGGIARFFGMLLSPILVISMVYACWHKKQSMGVLDSDGKILAWLRIETLNLSLLRYICKKVLKFRHGLDWSDIFDIYFRDEKHPNRRLAKRIYK